VRKPGEAKKAVADADFVPKPKVVKTGTAVATAAIVTRGSVALAFLIVHLAGWNWNALYAEILGLGGFAFAVLSNAVSLVASIRYARAIHPRLHLGGFLLGIAASFALLFLYARILP